jgi:tetratricopeptide (TPR) repeat protein
MNRLFVLLLIATACASPSAAETRLGTVTSIVGTVTIDAFGKGAFLPAVKGDALYASTILKAGVNGRATLDMRGQVSEVPPGAMVRIGDLAAADARKSGLKWFAAVSRLVESFVDASRRKESDLTLGTRAAEAGAEESTNTEWATEETDASALIPLARRNMAPGGYASALETLAKAVPPDDPALAWDLSFWKGFCYYQEQDYPDAVKHFSAARALGKSSPRVGDPAYRAVLLFQLGVSLYFVGEDKDAAAVLSSYLSDYPDGQFAEHAKMLIADLRK